MVFKDKNRGMQGIGILTIMALLMAAMTLLQGCSTEAGIIGQTVTEEAKNPENLIELQADPDSGIITVSGNARIPADQCVQRGLNNRIILVVSQYCSHCAKAIPVLKEIAEEKGVEITYLDISDNPQREELDRLKINTMFTPTLIAGCNTYIGYRPKPDYEQIINNHLEQQQKTRITYAEVSP